jgi:hypothetical protein
MDFHSERRMAEEIGRLIKFTSTPDFQYFAQRLPKLTLRTDMNDIEDKVYALMQQFIKPSVLVISNDLLSKILDRMHIPPHIAVESKEGWDTLNVGGHKLEIVRTYRSNVCEVYGKDRL